MGALSAPLGQQFCPRGALSAPLGASIKKSYAQHSSHTVVWGPTIRPRWTGPTGAHVVSLGTTFQTLTVKNMNSGPPTPNTMESTIVLPTPSRRIWIVCMGIILYLPGPYIPLGTSTHTHAHNAFWSVILFSSLRSGQLLHNQCRCRSTSKFKYRGVPDSLLLLLQLLLLLLQLLLLLLLMQLPLRGVPRRCARIACPSELNANVPPCPIVRARVSCLAM